MVAKPNETPELSILMPVFNEAGTVERAILDVANAELPFSWELIVVDDGSTDGSSTILAEGKWPDSVKVLHHDHNQGKGAAVRTALAEAHGEYAAILDADLEYSARDLTPLLEPLRSGDANVCFGVRAFNGQSSHSFIFVLGNRLVTMVANLLFNVYLGDLMTCHKVLRTDLFKQLPLREPGFAIEPEIAACVLNRGERIFEVPVGYRARRTEEGKKLTWVDGLRVVRTLVRCRVEAARGTSGVP